MGNQLPSPTLFKLGSKLYFPFLGAGIRVTKVSPGYKEIETKMKLHWYNRNAIGTHYGGNLYSMTDPFYMMMLLANIGKQHYVWDKSATIKFVRAVKTEVRATFRLTDDVIERIVEKAKDGEPHYVHFDVDVLDIEDRIVARVNKTVYIRRKPLERDSHSS